MVTLRRKVDADLSMHGTVGAGSLLPPRQKGTRSKSGRRWAAKAATGVNFFTGEVVTKRLELLHDLVPKAIRVAVLLNPANATTTETTLRDIQEAARAIGLQIHVLNAGTIGEIDAAFATLAGERTDALSSLPTGSSSAAACKLPP
jgi:ABC-type uncharacterized transport system substrate-binding protein